MRAIVLISLIVGLSADTSLGETGTLVKKTSGGLSIWERVCSTPSSGYIPQGMASYGGRLYLTAYRRSRDSAMFVLDSSESRFTKVFDMPLSATHASGIDFHPTARDRLVAVDYDSDRIYLIDFSRSVQRRQAEVLAESPSGLTGTSACCFVVVPDVGTRLLVTDFMNSGKNIAFQVDPARERILLDEQTWYRNYGYSQGITEQAAFVYETGNRGLSSSYVIRHRLSDSLRRRDIRTDASWLAPGPKIEDIAFHKGVAYISDEETKALYRMRQPDQSVSLKSLSATRSFDAGGRGGVSSVKVERGDQVEISARGSWKMGSFIGPCGADGMSKDTAQSYNMVKDEHHGKFLVRVSGERGWYPVGSSGVFYADRSGHLEWAPNDREPSNNGGLLQVTVNIRGRARPVPDPPPRGDYTLRVSGATTGSQTDFIVRKGQRVTIRASGTWKMGGFVGSCGPSGMSGYENYNRVASAPHGSLLVRVDGESRWTAIGSGRTFVAEESGRLVFSPNDREPDNNSGSLDVTVKLSN